MAGRVAESRHAGWRSDRSTPVRLFGYGGGILIAYVGVMLTVTAIIRDESPLLRIGCALFGVPAIAGGGCLLAWTYVTATLSPESALWWIGQHPSRSLAHARDRRAPDDFQPLAPLCRTYSSLLTVLLAATVIAATLLLFLPVARETRWLAASLPLAVALLYLGFVLLLGRNPIVVEARSISLAPGEDGAVRILFRRRVACSSFRMQLICTEEARQSLQERIPDGRTVHVRRTLSAVIHEQLLYERRESGCVVEFAEPIEVTCKLPPNAVPTFLGRHNLIDWRIVVAVAVPHRPGILREYRLPVLAMAAREP